MKYLVYASLLGVAPLTHATLMLHYDFEARNGPYTSWHYEDKSGNGYHAHEAGSHYNLNGETDPNGDMFANAGGERGGVYSYRWDAEVDYDGDKVINGVLGGAVGVWNNNSLNAQAEADLPNLGANQGLTIALWVNPQSVFFAGETRGHYGSTDTPNADFAHLVVIGGYGNAPIMSLELDSSLRVHGWVEGAGSSDAQVEVTGNASVNANEWAHIAITYDRANNVATTYINGLEDSQTDISVVGDVELDFSSVLIGREIGGNDIFIGQLDDIRVYYDVLGQPEIAGLVPEPSRYVTLFGTLGLGVSLICRRRRS